MRLLASALLASASIVAATPANAVIYVGEQSTFFDSFSYRIDTDGSTGVLGTAAINWFEVTVRTTSPFGGATRETRFSSPGAPTPGTGSFRVTGIGLTATATELFFNFNQFGAQLLLSGSGGLPEFSFDGPVRQADPSSAGGYRYREDGSDSFFGSSGRQVIATALSDPTTPTDPVAAVPEPATWAMMIGGFGLVGGAMRRRQRTAVTYA